MPIIGGTPEQIEARAELARQKYGARTISEILSRIIVYTLIGYIAIFVVVLLMFFSPLDDRVLACILLAFVLVEMLTEYALWAFSYQGMRRTEAPLADLQKFSTITKEGWRRAELVMDITTPFFSWLEGVRERMFPDWRNKDDAKLEKMEPVTAKDIVDGLAHLAQSIETMNGGLKAMDSRVKVMEGKDPGVRWGSDKLSKD